MSTVERGEEDRKGREGNGGDRILCSLSDSEVTNRMSNGQMTTYS